MILTATDLGVLHMDNIDGAIRALREDIARLGTLRTRLQSLYAQRDELAAREAELAEIAEDEADDVRRLEGRSLARYFFGLTGSLDDRLDREQAEAREAAVRHDAVARELDGVEDAVAAAEAELRRLDGCERRYEELLERKAAMLKAAGSAAGARLGELERREATLVRRSREIDEALAAGARAEQLALEVLESLSSASTWGLVDMVSDSFFSDMIKYSHIDEAQSRIEALQAQLRRFGTELRDVDGSGMGLNIQIDGFLTFADYFFDNFFVDMAVNSRIDRAAQEAEAVLARIRSTLANLEAMRDDTAAEAGRLDREYEQLVTEGI